MGRSGKVTVSVLPSANKQMKKFLGQIEAAGLSFKSFYKVWFV
jgi:hypothetical protein